MLSADQIIDRYPQLKSLRAFAPDEVIEDEIGSHIDNFEHDLVEAKRAIPTVNLDKVFPSELEKGAIQLSNFLGHWGNVSVEELCKICLIVKWLKPKRILELGTYNGMTTLQMAKNAPSDCTTYTLDLNSDQAASLKLSKLDELVSKHLKSKFNTATGSYFTSAKELNIVQLWGDTANFDYSVVDGPVDLIFIDAAHDYENKKIDCENAFRLLSDNGVILWHNYADVCCPDVTKCLKEYAQDNVIFHLRNTYLAVYRKA